MFLKRFRDFSTFFSYCLTIPFATAPITMDQLNAFYEEFLCEEKNLLSTVGIGSCCCGTVPYPTSDGYVTPDPILFSSEVWSFVSEPSLHPMMITVNLKPLSPSVLASGPIFLAPYAFSESAMIGQPGSLIVDNDGNPIWFRPLSTNLMNTDFRVQQLNGQSVLTFWQGSLATPPAYTNAPGGSSEPGSCYYILDNTYSVIQTVSAQNGFTSDIHEFLLTPNHTALFLSTMPVPMDLTAYGGPANGFVQNFAVQEVDLETNELLFFWTALDHIPLTDSFEPASSATSSGNIWDAYHLNSVGITDTETDIIISGRNTFTIYRINKQTGDIVWRLGGTESTFAVDMDAQFSWQHDARFLSSTSTTQTISLFDDNCCEGDTVPPETPPAHGLVLLLDLNSLSASLVTSYYHNPLINVSSQGNVQTLSNGNKFIGWGQSQYYSEFAEDGNTEGTPAVNLLYDAQMPSGNYSYRAYRNTWVATPYYPPSIAVTSSNGHRTVYASWNGSTETTTWQVFAGSKSNHLSMVASGAKTGFETAISTNAKGPYFQVKALNSSNGEIGLSEVVQLK